MIVKKHTVFTLVVLVGRTRIFGDASGYRGFGFVGQSGRVALPNYAKFVIKMFVRIRANGVFYAIGGNVGLYVIDGGIVNKVCAFDYEIIAVFVAVFYAYKPHAA